MKYTLLLDRKEDTKKIQDQEQSRFIKSIIETFEFPIDFDPNTSLTLDKKIELRKSLAAHKIDIIDDMDGGLKVFFEKEVIAQWHKPSFKLKEDRNQLDPKNRLYLEMTISFITNLDEQTKGEE